MQAGLVSAFRATGTLHLVLLQVFGTGGVVLPGRFCRSCLPYCQLGSRVHVQASVVVGDNLSRRCGSIRDHYSTLY